MHTHLHRRPADAPVPAPPENFFLWFVGALFLVILAGYLFSR